jgi:hypothetical protein
VTFDPDRSILSFRERTKPHFVVEDDRLRLTNTPIPLISTKAWVEDHPSEIRSYFFSVLLRFVDLVGANLDDKNVSNKLEEKRRVNRLLLNETFRLANTEEMRLAFILFYSQAEITHEGWREEFLKETLRELNAPYLDTKALLLQTAERRGIKISEFYDETDHHTALGNAIIAEGLAAFMQREGWDEPKELE